jgi:hypothetical protein
MHLSKDDILKAADTRTEEVEVPEWGGTVLVRGLTGLERDDYEMSLMVERGGRMVMDTANGRAKLAVRCCVDDDGSRIFDDADANTLGRKSGKALDRVFDVAARLSGLREEDAKAAAENFGVAPNGTSSNSVLPVTSG